MYKYLFNDKVYSSNTIADLQKQLSKVGFKGNVKLEIQKILTHTAEQNEAVDQYEKELPDQEEAINEMYEQLNAADEFESK
jgi:hypothetical protein